MLKTEVIKLFLLKHTHTDLAQLYNFNMEVQVNVLKGNGEPIVGEYKGKTWRGYSDGIETWKPFRIPHNAKIDPTYTDSNVTFDFEKHVEAIGLTGWDWVNKQSKYVAFDFDAISGHSEKHSKKLTTSELEEVKTVVSDIPWVTVRRSTGGNGLHLYIFLDNVNTNNHTEHAALARAILNQLSALTGYDFNSKVDICGSNMWVYHRKLLTSTKGLELIKQGEILIDVPENWKEHINVINGRRTKTIPSFIDIDNIGDIDAFEQLSGTNIKTPLDSGHKKLLLWLQNNNCSWWWDADHHMLVCHTYDLKLAHNELVLKGIFDTISQGTEKGTDHNCFAYPMRNSSWVVRRYNKGTSEAKTWSIDSNGWTRCYYNKQLDLATCCRINDGVEHPNGGYYFKHAEMAQKVILDLGGNINLPSFCLARKARLKDHKTENKIIIELTAETEDDGTKMQGFLNEKGLWKSVILINNEKTTDNNNSDFNSDEILRHLLTPSNEDYGWVVQSEGSWRIEPLPHVKAALSSLGLAPKDVTSILGSGIFKAWTIVNMPFQPEYPGNRQWNKDAPQLKHSPKSCELDDLNYSVWNKLLSHIGSGLDDAIKYNDWCKLNEIYTGADYLKCWLASIIKEPEQPLPYLFLYGNQGCGKSIFHESLNLLFTKGIVRADNALTSGSGFNGELEHAIVCVIEETNLQKSKVAYNRIKDWVTSPSLMIHRKQRTPYTIQNTTHYIQCANESYYCPIFTGDTRITMIHVQDLQEHEKLSKRDLISELNKQAQDFLTYLYRLELPKSNDRLNIPVIITDDKLQAAEGNKTPLELFIDEYCFYFPGQCVLFSEFYNKFIDWVDPNLAHQWNKNKVSREIPAPYLKGKLTSDVNRHIGNISFTNPATIGIDISKLAKYVARDGFLILNK